MLAILLEQSYNKGSAKIFLGSAKYFILLFV